MTKDVVRQAPARHLVLLGLALGLVAANLRPALASVGPVLEDVRTDLGLNGTLAALLVSVPVFCLGALAPAAPRLARRWGIEPVIAVVLVGIAAGLLLRVVGRTGLLFAGTVLTAGAIAVANVLLPALIKRDFPTRSGAMMGVYTMALSSFAALAAAGTVPLSEVSGYGWRGGLGAWSILAVLALLAWLPFANARTPPPVAEPPRSSLLRDPLAWQVTVFFGLQSLFFYSVLSWLPSIYRDQGYSPAEAGLVLFVVTLVQIPVTLLIPRFAARARDQRRYLGASTVLTAVGLAGVLIAPTTMPYLWAAITGAGLGSAFALGLLLFVLRGRTATDTAQLSAMAQTFGYLLAASGPLLLGAVHDLTGSWSPPLALLLVLVGPQFVAGILAGRPRHLGHQGSAPR